MAARTRTTIVQGIYKDAHGVSVIARIGSGAELREAKARFPLVDDDGIPYSKKNCGELIKARLQLLEDLRRARAAAGGDAGTLGGAITTWRVTFPIPVDAKDPGRKKRQYAHSCLAHWMTTPLARVPVDDVKRSQVRHQLAEWLTAGVSPSSVNHRKHALAVVLGETLGVDDDSDVTLVTDGIGNVPPRPIQERGLPMPILARLLATMPDRGAAAKGEPRPTVSHTKIRMHVMAWTGLSHISLERLERRRVNFRTGKLYYPPREKGAGAEGIWVDLLPPAIEWLRAFDRANLWGRKFSRSSMRRTYLRAVSTLRQELVAQADESGDRTLLDQFLEVMPENPYPYDTRHSFLSDVYRQTGDIKAAREIAQHADVSTTDRYTKSAVKERVAAAIDTMRNRWFPEAPPKDGATVLHLVQPKQA